MIPPRSNRVVPRRSGVASLVAAALLLTGCKARDDAPKPGAASLPAAPVRLAATQFQTNTTTERVMGALRAKSQATLEAKVSGRVEAMPVVLGRQLKAGDLVARLAAPEINARLSQAEASQAQAESDWARVSSLFAQQAATKSELDAAQARQRVAQAAAAEARAMLAHAAVMAPFDAVVSKKWAEVGDLASPGKPLVSIEDPATLQLEADLPAALAANVRPGAPLAAQVDGLDAPLMGTVAEIAPAADPASRTVRIRVDLPKTSGLRSGQFARLEIPAGRRASLRVPASAVVVRGQMEIVFTAAAQRATLRLVTTGQLVDGEVEILSGLHAGDLVVVEGAAGLVDGQPVEAR
jgi:membrane fusion protein (multidrug efflux system)